MNTGADATPEFLPCGSDSKHLSWSCGARANTRGRPGLSAGTGNGPGHLGQFQEFKMSANYRQNPAQPVPETWASEPNQSRAAGGGGPSEILLCTLVPVRQRGGPRDAPVTSPPQLHRRALGRGLGSVPRPRAAQRPALLRLRRPWGQEVRGGACGRPPEGPASAPGRCDAAPQAIAAGRRGRPGERRAAEWRGARARLTTVPDAGGAPSVAGFGSAWAR